MRNLLKKITNISPSLFINPSSREFIIYLWNFGARFLNNVGYDEGGAVQKQQNDNHTKTTRGHMPTHRISVILPCFAPVGLLLSR